MGREVGIGVSMLSHFLTCCQDTVIEFRTNWGHWHSSTLSRLQWLWMEKFAHLLSWASWLVLVNRKSESPGLHQGILRCRTLLLPCAMRRTAASVPGEGERLRKWAMGSCSLKQTLVVWCVEYCLLQWTQRHTKRSDLCSEWIWVLQRERIHDAESQSVETLSLFPRPPGRFFAPPCKGIVLPVH